jgi:hypothetical protein
MSTSGINRPLKFGPNDRREFIVQNSETAVLAENNASGDPIYYGRAKAGSSSSEEKWQIRYIQYDANQGITSITWPQNSEGNPSTNYEFAWDDRATYTYS